MGVAVVQGYKGMGSVCGMQQPAAPRSAGGSQPCMPPTRPAPSVLAREPRSRRLRPSSCRRHRSSFACFERRAPMCPLHARACQRDFVGTNRLRVVTMCSTNILDRVHNDSQSQKLETVALNISLPCVSSPAGSYSFGTQRKQHGLMGIQIL